VEKSHKKSTYAESLSWNDFEVLDIIGSGSFGRVFKVKPLYRCDQTYLVIKELQTDRMPDCEARKTMMEIELLNKIKQTGSKYVVGYIDAFIYDSSVNIVFECCDRGDLASFITKRSKSNLKQISESSLLKIFL
jgi:serine/threonine protein kinase